MHHIYMQQKELIRSIHRLQITHKDSKFENLKN